MDAVTNHEGHFCDTSILKIPIPGTNQFICKMVISLNTNECEYKCNIKTGRTTTKATLIHHLIKITEEHYKRGI